MGEPARAIDLIDTAPAFGESDAIAFNNRYRGTDTLDMLRELLTGPLSGRVAAVSSFGTESAVLLHLMAQVDNTIPVIFVNTQKMFGETLAYRDELSERLGLRDLRVHRPDPDLLAAKDATGLRWSFDPDGCCDIRKVQPLRRALTGFDAWLSGRKGFQSGTRTGLPRFEIDEGRLKVNPLADWDRARLDAYFAEHKLPRHPLEAKGYLSIGCAPCTSIVKPGEDPRAGRWRGWEKVECGIHGEVVSVVDDDPANDPVF
jgi:phosphoadenosine phosphosulfate reductase